MATSFQLIDLLMANRSATSSRRRRRLAPSTTSTGFTCVATSGILSTSSVTSSSIVYEVVSLGPKQDKRKYWQEQMTTRSGIRL